jgi:two-component sensor histidine kinase
MRGGEPYDVEYRLRDAAGAYRWFHARAAVQREESGQPTRIFGTSSDVSDRKEGEERQQLMTRELHHRVKNTLATVQAVISATARRAETIGEFYQSVTDRIVSLAKTHTLLVNNTWGGATVRDLLEGELAPYADGSNRRILLDGPDVHLSSEIALALGMAAHELTTNAAKYGSLSLPDGRVEVRWRLSDDGTSIVFEWFEHDGPPVQEPSRKGFGSLLLERVLGSRLKGDVTVEYAPEGLRLRMKAPLRGSTSDGN